MSLIEAEYIKQNFPEWEHYAGYDKVAASIDAALDNQIEQASIELSDYITVTDETITQGIKRHLFRIVKKNLFELKHGDTEFKRPPQILTDYKRSIEMLTELRNGSRASTPPTPETQQGNLKITAKNRRFGPGQWFNNSGNYEVNSNE